MFLPSAQRVYAKVIIKIGDRAYRFENDDSGIHARLHANGKLLLH